jgi:hypothetical protein
VTLSIVLISVAVCLISVAIGWLTKNYLWPGLWSALTILVPGPAFVGSFLFGLLAVYIAKSRAADGTKERQ